MGVCKCVGGNDGLADGLPVVLLTRPGVAAGGALRAALAASTLAAGLTTALAGVLAGALTGVLAIALTGVFAGVFAATLTVFTAFAETGVAFFPGTTFFAAATGFWQQLLLTTQLF